MTENTINDPAGRPHEELADERELEPESDLEMDRRAAWPSPLLRGPDGQKRKALDVNFDELEAT